MKPKYTLVVTDNESGKEILDFDMTHLNYKIETDCGPVGNPVAKLNFSGACILGDIAEESIVSVLPCSPHSWIHYAGLAGSYSTICGICGVKNEEDAMR